MHRSILILVAGVYGILASPSIALAQQPEDEFPLEKMSGKQIYDAYCSRCHGEDGKGNIDPEIAAGMEVPPPDFTEGYFASREKRKDWQAVVAHGGGIRGLSMSMPAWNEALSDRQIAETVEHVKSFIDQSIYPQGELNFFRGHTTTKAFLEQEVLLIPTHQFTKQNGITTRETKLVAYYANRLGYRFQYEVKIPMHSRSSAGSNRFGIGDLELGLKYALYDNHRTLTLFSVGFETAFPTGSEAKGFGSGTVSAVPFLAAAQGIGDNLQLSTSVKLELPLDGAKGGSELRAGLLSLIPLSDSKQGFFPGIEFFVRKNLRTSVHSLSIIPQVYWGITARGHLALSMGAEIPVAGTKTFDGKIVAFLLWDYVDGGLWW